MNFFTDVRYDIACPFTSIWHRRYWVCILRFFSLIAERLRIVLVPLEKMTLRSLDSCRGFQGRWSWLVWHHPNECPVCGLFYTNTLLRQAFLGLLLPCRGLFWIPYTVTPSSKADDTQLRRIVNVDERLRGWNISAFSIYEPLSSLSCHDEGNHRHTF